jgi:hypothetical protein
LPIDHPLRTARDPDPHIGYVTEENYRNSTRRSSECRRLSRRQAESVI